MNIISLNILSQLTWLRNNDTFMFHHSKVHYEDNIWYQYYQCIFKNCIYEYLGHKWRTDSCFFEDLNLSFLYWTYYKSICGLCIVYSPTRKTNLLQRTSKDTICLYTLELDKEKLSTERGGLSFTWHSRFLQFCLCAKVLGSFFHVFSAQEPLMWACKKKPLNVILSFRNKHYLT